MYETQLSAAEACRHPLIRRGERPLNRAVLQRWFTQGLLYRGNRIVLESWRVGGLRATSVEALERFLARLNGREVDGPTPAQAKREHDVADRQLQAAGI